MSCYIDNVFYLIITLQISNHFQRIFIIFFLVTCVYYALLLDLIWGGDVDVRQQVIQEL